MAKSMAYLLLFVFLAFSVPAWAQTATQAASTNNAPLQPVVTPVPIGDVVIQAASAMGTLQSERQSLQADSAIQTAMRQIAQVKTDVDQQTLNQSKTLSSGTSLSDLQTILDSWQGIEQTIASIKASLGARASGLASMETTLLSEQKSWQATLTAAQTNSAPPEAVSHVQAVLTEIRALSTLVHASQAQLLSVQSQVVEQDNRVQTCLTAIDQAKEAARTQLFMQDSPALWSLGLEANAARLTSEAGSFSSQWAALEVYLLTKIPELALHATIFLVLAFCLYWVGGILKSKTSDEAALAQTAQVFQVPISTALLLALLTSGLLYPLAPRILYAVVGTIALVPVVLILRRLLEPKLYPILYAVVVTYLIDQLRYVLVSDGLTTRFLLIFELLLTSVFLVWLLHSNRLNNASRAFVFVSRLYLHVALLACIFTGFAELFGYGRLAELLSRGILKSSYLAIVFYAAVRILNALSFAALQVPPLSSVKMLRIYQGQFYKNTSRSITGLAVGLWVLAALQLFEVRQPLWQYTGAVLGSDVHWGSVSLSLGSVLAFGITVWLAFLISRFIRFILEEEVYPHLQLSRGIPYAANMMVHYTILLLGFFVSLQVLGINLSNFSILAGAFGVGLGFGLQNIMNNFVSGLILLFERPIRVGDTIQVESSLGIVDRIGIRASVVRLTNGSEVIVPNGNLISNPVVNWSLPENQRIVEVSVSVAPKAEPNHILELLIAVATADSRVLKQPAPRAFLVTITGTALAFRLRTSIESSADFLQVTSDLSLNIYNALAKENIVLAP